MATPGSTTFGSPLQTPRLSSAKTGMVVRTMMVTTERNFAGEHVSTAAAAGDDGLNRGSNPDREEGCWGTPGWGHFVMRRPARGGPLGRRRTHCCF
mmetsp:Transcript_34614/g.77370  ORF Transcript_34614/g.77370 Transcript_34614/m.77370 type:complete len:96 (-) Transcript_34614:159-446(-)